MITWNQNISKQRFSLILVSLSLFACLSQHLFVLHPSGVFHSLSLSFSVLVVVCACVDETTQKTISVSFRSIRTSMIDSSILYMCHFPICCSPCCAREWKEAKVEITSSPLKKTQHTYTHTNTHAPTSLSLFYCVRLFHLSLFFCIAIHVSLAILFLSFFFYHIYRQYT